MNIQVPASSRARIFKFVATASYLALMFCVLPARAADTYPLTIKQLGTQDGLSQSTALDIHQDQQGFIWIATESGLNRYDGYSITRYHRGSDTSIPDDFIYTIAERDNGDMWFGTARGSVLLWERNSDQFRTVPFVEARHKEAATPSVRKLLSTSDGLLWIGTRGNGLTLLDPATGETKTYRHDANDPVSLPSDHVNEAFEDRSGNIWVGTNKGLARLLPDRQSFKRFPTGDKTRRGISGIKVRSIYEDHQGVIWVGTAERGVSAYFRNSGQFVSYQTKSTDASSFCGNSVSAIVQDNDERLWFATEQGLCLYDRESNSFSGFGVIDDSKGLTDSDLMSLMVDRSGQLWIGTRHDGINISNPQSWLFGHTLPALDLSGVTSFATDLDGLWVGTMGKGLLRISERNPQPKFFNKATGLTDDRIMALETSADDHIWVGTMSGGLMRLAMNGTQTGSWRTDSEPGQQLPSNAVMSLLEDSKGRLWIGTYGEGVARLDANRSHIDVFSGGVNSGSGLAGNQAMVIEEDATGSIWVGTEAGLHHFDEDGGAFESFVHDPDEPDSLAAEAVYALHSDASGNLWVGTAGGGLDRVVLNEEAIQFEHHTAVIELGANLIYGIQSDLEGNLWLSGNRGLVRYTPTTEKGRRFKAAQGLQDDEFNFGAHHSGIDGRLLFGGPKGFNQFDPAALNIVEVPPQVVITNIEIQGRPLPNQFSSSVKALELTYEDDLVTLEFAILDYVDSDSNRFEYQLNGHDTRWIKSGNSRRASYSGLAPGNYVFRVKGANSSGVWSDTPAQLHLTVQPPPWKTNLAYALYATFALLLLMGISRTWRNRRAAERAHQQELYKLAYFDPLTGLSNRNHLISESVNLLKAAAEASTHVAVLHMNYHNFKRVNDSLGHAKADHLLQLIADRITRHSASLHHSPVLIARVGGDEFAIVAAGFDSIEHVTQFATRLQASMSDTIILAHSEMRVSFSVGITCFPEDGTSIEVLLKNADLAVRNAKETGRNTICAYRSSMDTGIEDELQLEIEFLKAIDTGQLELHYQPKVDAKTRKVVGAEALIRWNHPERGLVSPGTFIPMAERTGLIANMDSWVMKSIFQQQQAWQSMRFPRVITSFNVSAGQFCRVGFLNQLRDLTTTYEVDTSTMEIEITEGVLMHDAKLARQNLDAIKEMGFRIAIDDFGTGYSSLSYLKNFAVDVLKIDRSFVTDLETDENNRSLCNAIIALGKSLNLEVTAEGIETKEQFEFLMHAGCDEIQGYWVARPEPLTNFERFVLDNLEPGNTNIPSLVSTN